MRKLKFLGAATLLTLVASGVAVAHEGTKQSKTDAVTATFTAERTAVSERTCTGTDGHTYRVAREEFRGTVTSADARLAGTLVLRTKSVIDQTNGLGQTSGHAKILGADGKRKGQAGIVAANTEHGVLNGVAAGHVRRAGDTLPGGHIVANFRAQFSSATTLAGELGAGASQNSANIQSFRGCATTSTNNDRGKDDDRSDDKKKSGKAKLFIKQGEVTALSATSLAVKVGDATVTFSVTDRLAKLCDELDVEVGSKVKIAYVVKGDATMLVKLRKA